MASTQFYYLKGKQNFIVRGLLLTKFFILSTYLVNAQVTTLSVGRMKVVSPIVKVNDYKTNMVVVSNYIAICRNYRLKNDLQFIYGYKLINSSFDLNHDNLNFQFEGNVPSRIGLGHLLSVGLSYELNTFTNKLTFAPSVLAGFIGSSGGISVLRVYNPSGNYFIQSSVDNSGYFNFIISPNISATIKLSDRMGFVFNIGCDNIFGKTLNTHYEALSNNVVEYEEASYPNISNFNFGIGISFFPKRTE